MAVAGTCAMPSGSLTRYQSGEAVFPSTPLGPTRSIGCPPVPSTTTSVAPVVVSLSFPMPPGTALTWTPFSAGLTPSMTS